MSRVRLDGGEVEFEKLIEDVDEIPHDTTAIVVHDSMERGTAIECLAAGEAVEFRNDEPTMTRVFAMSDYRTEDALLAAIKAARDEHGIGANESLSELFTTTDRQEGSPGA